MGFSTGSSSTSGYSVTAPPKYVSNVYKDVLGQAQDVAATPYTPYSGQLTAGLTDAQQQATAGLGAAQTAYQPYYDKASTYTDQGTTALNPMEFNAEAIQKYQNPYTSQVVDATLADLARLFGTQQNQVTGNAIASGAWGGDRAGIVKSNLAGNQAQTAATTLAGLRQASYDNALQQFNTANQTQLGAQQQNNANALAAAGLYQGLGTGASTNAVNLNNALLNAGTVGQQTDQAGLDAQYQQFLNEQQYPFESLSWLTGVATGIGSNAGGTSFGNSETSGTSFGGNLGDLIPSDERVKEDIEPVGELYDGQPIYRYRYKGDPTPRIGLIAQDVEQVHPEAVGQIAGLRGVDYGAATEDAAGMGGLMGYAGGGEVMPYDQAKGRPSGLSLPIVAPSQGGGPPKGGIPDPGKPPSLSGSGGGGSTKQSAQSRQQSIEAIKDKYAPLPGLGPSAGGDMSVQPGLVPTGIVEAPGSVGLAGASGASLGGLGQLASFLPFADGGAVEEEEEVPLIFGPDPIKDQERFPMDQDVAPKGDRLPIQRPDVDPLPSRPTGPMMAGLGALAAAVPQGGGLAGNKSQPRGVRTNNPGNIKDSEFARSQPGYVGSDGVNAIFETPESGYAAMNKLLDVYGRKHGLNTVSGILNRWAPASADNNDTSGYTSYVAKRLGIDPNAPLTPEARAALPQAMAYFENGQEFPTSGGNPLASMQGSMPRPGLTPQGGDEPMMPANARPAAGLAPPPQDDDRASKAGWEAGMLTFLSTLNPLQALATGLQTTRDVENRMRGVYTPEERYAQLQAEKIQAEIQASRQRLQTDQAGTWTVVGPVNDGDGNVIGTAVINNRTGEVVTRPIGVTKKAGPEADVEGRKRAAARAGLDPSSPAYQSFILTGKMPREDQAPLTATDKKAILEADEGVLAAQTAIDNLKQAEELSKTAFTGFGADFRSTLGSKLPDMLVHDSIADPEGSSSTVQLNNLVMTNALSQLKAIFGAAPTEGERKILMDIQGSSSLSHEDRVKIYQRAAQLAAKRLEMNKQRAEELRGGTFYKPKQEGDPLADAKAAISKGAPRDAVIQRLKERGIDTSGL